MLSPEIRARLSRLNRTALPEHEGTGRVDPRPPRSMSELPAGETVQNGCGEHWQLQTELQQLWPDASRVIHETLSGLSRETEAGETRSRELLELNHAFPHKLLLLDLETCGLGGAMVFLIGLVHFHQDQLVLTQLLARDYSEEAAILQSLWKIAAKQDVLVTFNGKSFDWPLVHDRSTLHHLGQDPRQASSAPRGTSAKHTPGRLGREDRRADLLHCDILHHSRRRWKHRLPDCRLQTLEKYLCGRYRSGDIPGRLIPNAYHDFVRSGDAWQIRNVLHHNALDLVTLLELSCRLLDTSAKKELSIPEEG